MIINWKCIGHITSCFYMKWEWKAKGSESLVNTAEVNGVLRKVGATVKLVTFVQRDQVNSAKNDSVYNVCNNKLLLILQITIDTCLRQIKLNQVENYFICFELILTIEVIAKELKYI